MQIGCSVPSTDELINAFTYTHFVHQGKPRAQYMCKLSTLMFYQNKMIAYNIQRIEWNKCQHITYINGMLCYICFKETVLLLNSGCFRTNSQDISNTLLWKP